LICRKGINLKNIHLQNYFIGSNIMNEIMSIDYNKCAYMNPEKQNADVMLRPCINGSDPLVWPCIERELMDKDIFSLTIERPQGDNISRKLNHSLGMDQKDTKKDKFPVNNDIEKDMFEDPNVEGFTNMGEQYVKPGDLRDGYFKCPKTGEIKQVCMNCKYNQRTYGKSKEFNEGDACFPNRGVYDGIDNQGNTRCTCGLRGQYCNDNFTAQGGFLSDDIFIMNVGNFDSLSKLASY